MKKPSLYTLLPIAGLAYFALAILIAHLLRPDVDMVTKTVSHYARGEYGLLAVSAFVVQGSSMVLLAVLLQMRLMPRSYWGTGPLAIAGVSVIVLGLFPIDPSPQVPSMIGAVHRYATISDMCATLVAMVYWTRYFGNHRRQHRVYYLSFGLFALAWTSSVLVFATGGAPVLGVTQRVSIVVFWAWLNTAAFAMLLEGGKKALARSEAPIRQAPSPAGYLIQPLRLPLQNVSSLSPIAAGIIEYGGGDMRITSEDALIIVDVQNDFCPGGSLAVPGGDRVAATMTQVARMFRSRGGRVFATQDWHPAGHSSFKEQGGPWPPHCVQGTKGAEFHPNLVLPEDTVVIRKGSDPKVDAYSGFIDSDLDARLRRASVNRLFVGGLATDYCVLNTVLDALRNGYETYLLTDAIGAVDVTPGDGERAIGRMRDAGAGIAASGEVLKA